MSARRRITYARLFVMNSFFILFSMISCHHLKLMSLSFSPILPLSVYNLLRNCIALLCCRLVYIRNAYALAPSHSVRLGCFSSIFAYKMVQIGFSKSNLHPDVCGQVGNGGYNFVKEGKKTGREQIQHSLMVRIDNSSSRW